MKKLLTLALALCLVLTLLGAACAEEIAALDGSDAVIVPIDMTSYAAFGPEPDPAGYTTTTYSDPSIQVEMERVWVGESCFNVAHVKIAHPSQIRTALAGKLGKKTNYVWNIAAKHNAVVAIGGEDLAENDKTYTVRMGVTERKRGYAGRDTLIIDQNGDFHVMTGYSDEARLALEAEGVVPVNLFNFGPALIVDGELQQIPAKYSVGNPGGKEPRTAIGQLGPLEYLLVVVDGRDVKDPTPDGAMKPSKGTDVATVAQFLLDRGCVQAYNLDGGGSAVMCFAGDETNGGTYSHPSSKRGVSDIIYFASAVEVK